MNKFNVIAMVGFVPVKVVSDGTKEGTVIEAENDMDRGIFHAAIRDGINVSLGGRGGAPSAVASYETPIGIAAAIFAISPQHTEILRAPVSVMNLLAPSQADLQF